MYGEINIHLIILIGLLGGSKFFAIKAMIFLLLNASFCRIDLLKKNTLELKKSKHLKTFDTKFPITQKNSLQNICWLNKFKKMLHIPIYSPNKCISLTMP